MDEQWARRPLAKRQALFKAFFANPDWAGAEKLLALIRAPQGYGVYASVGPNYQYAIFARDALTVAEDLLATHPNLVKEIILLLARLQGTETNSTTEEEPGKIHHEYRAVHFNGEPVSDAAKQVLEALKDNWGSTDGELLYYGACDTTPVYVRLVCRYVQLYDPALFDEELAGRGGTTKTVRESVQAALDWLIQRIEASPWGLLEYQRRNPLGLLNQAWKDSTKSYLHLGGEVANADGGIASVELQGYAYDALFLAAEVLAANEDERTGYLRRAQQLGTATVASLWMNDEQFFAIGCDRDEDGLLRQIQTRTSNAGALLNSRLLYAVPLAQRRSYLEPVVRRLMSPEFLTPVGIRCRSLAHANLVDIADYHGSLVSWPKDTFEVAKGFDKWGFEPEAEDLRHCLRHAFTTAGEAYEFFYVSRAGRVKYHYRQEHPDEPTFHDFGAANLPEPGQAWSISAVIAAAEIDAND